MKIHLPALLALVSAATYVACGSSDGSKREAEASAGDGQGGEGPSAAGSKGSGGFESKGGTQTGVSGEAGAPTAGGAPLSAGGAGGRENGGGGGGDSGAAGGGGDNGGSSGLAGAGGEGPDLGLPVACPGALSDYTTLTGTADGDVFSAADIAGKKLIFGLDGADTFPAEHGGDDCLVGGPGNDDFTNSDEFASYYYGGPGDDVYHVNTAGNYVRIADMEAGDRIALSASTYTLTGVPGEPAAAVQVVSVPDFSTGASTNSESSVLVYDPNTGELWRDVGGGVKDTNSALVLTILNHDSYVFSIDDFIIE